MDKRTCRLCGRRFANGLARAGHMRSHALAAAKARPIIPASPSSSEGTAPFDGPRWRRSTLAADPEFTAVAAAAAVDAASSSVVQDGESDAESSIAPALRLERPARRSKRPASQERIGSSSVSSGTHEEDVARCLMMLSRDVWTESAAADKEGERSEERDRIAGDRSRRRRKQETVAEGSRYQCGTCKKVFGSYHALGGHRAGHKKAKGSCAPAGEIRIHADLVHDRPFASRIFNSGDKKSGDAATPAVIAPPAPSSIGSSISPTGTVIDLNQPAPVEGEQDLELCAAFGTPIRSRGNQGFR